MIEKKRLDFRFWALMLLLIAMSMKSQRRLHGYDVISTDDELILIVGELTDR